MNNTFVLYDCGYGYGKMIGLDRPGKIYGPVTAPSAYARTGRILTEKDQRDRPRLHIPALGDTAFYWGDHVRYSRDPVFSRARERPHEMLRVLFCGLLSELKITGPVAVYTALPVEWLADADHIRAALTGRHQAERMDTGRLVDVSVSEVVVFPQPQCSFFQRADTDGSLWEDTVNTLIVDVGTGTANVSFVAGGSWIDERARSVAFGMGHVLEQALQAQEQALGGRDLLLVARAKLWEGDAQMIDWATPAIEQLAQKINEAIADVRGDALVSVTILTGGGGRFVEAYLDLPGVVSVSEAPELDNLYGLLAMAREELEG